MWIVLFHCCIVFYTVAMSQFIYTSYPLAFGQCPVFLLYTHFINPVHAFILFKNIFYGGVPITKFTILSIFKYTVQWH